MQVRRSDVAATSVWDQMSAGVLYHYEDLKIVENTPGTHTYLGARYLRKYPVRIYEPILAM